MSKRRIYWLVAFVMVVHVPHAYADNATRSSALELVKKYTRALDSLSSSIEQYELTMLYNWQFGRKGKGTQVPGGTNQEMKSRGEFRHEGLSYYFQRYSWGDTSEGENLSRQAPS